jgi:hypothetical protein
MLLSLKNLVPNDAVVVNVAILPPHLAVRCIKYIINRTVRTYLVAFSSTFHTKYVQSFILDSASRSF